jgi:hypothetical protein
MKHQILLLFGSDSESGRCEAYRVKVNAKSATIAAANPWIYGPWLDMIVGCGAWSAPLLLLATLTSAQSGHTWGVAFYLLAVAFNYPHFMATVYRAYHTREDFAKYRIFTPHLTALLALTAILAHASFPLVPWIFTLYICWSPWHYARPELRAPYSVIGGGSSAL